MLQRAEFIMEVQFLSGCLTTETRQNPNPPPPPPPPLIWFFKVGSSVSALRRVNSGTELILTVWDAHD